MMLRNKRLSIALLFSLLVAGVFWSQSRIPALNEKAQMGLRNSLGEIAFDIILPVTASQHMLERVMRSSVNWAYTNWIGMTFGLLIAAAALTILGSIRQRSFRQPWLNTLSGALAGAPLGVCVNCATPIAQGIYSAGARLETALSAMIASPTLNVIVLTMTFTLLPWELAVTKLASVVILLSLIPMLVRRFATAPDRSAPGAIESGARGLDPPQISLTEGASGNESLVDAARGFGFAYLRALLYLVKIAVPLMLLAGVLGALAIELVPFEYFSNIDSTPIAILLCALVATALPVPIAFDVIIVTVLLANGMDPGLAAVLLCALGVFSVYPGLVIGRYISARLSIAMAAVVVLIASGFGLAAASYFEREMNEEQALISAGIGTSGEAALAGAIEVCDNLPEYLHDRCFATHIEQFDRVVPREAICLTRPRTVSVADCTEMLEDTFIRAEALANSNSAQCTGLGSTTARNQCNYEVVLRSALSSHDINACNDLTDGTTVSACRAQFINSSLLFNPDDSVCRSLLGTELTDCRTNAAIYRWADTMDFEACIDLGTPDAVEYCRYVIASSMIGRRNDPSGCAQLADSALGQRCQSLVTAWQATRERSLDRCWELRASDLRDTCLLRVADADIDAVLTRHALTPSIDTLGSINGTDTELAMRTVVVPAAPDQAWRTLQSTPGGEINFAEFAESATDGFSGFERIAAAELGISDSWNFRATDFFEPFIIGKGIASGDLNGDLWPDVALATEAGLLVYQNTGGQFSRLPIDQGELANENLFLVAFVDADNDGRQDIFASAYGGRNFILVNSGSGFLNAELVQLDGNHRLTMSAGFGDLDQNGELDIVLGNWTSGAEMRFAPEQSGNAILYREAGAWRTEPLNDIRGETNSVLLADLNDDDLTDLLIGNDRIVPDAFYINAGDGVLQLVTPASRIVPTTSMFTMSIDAADFNNDLAPDLFSTDMTFARSTRDDYCSSISELGARERCANMLELYEQFQDGSASACSELTGALEQHECFVAFTVSAAKALKDQTYCANLPDENASVHSLCLHLASPIPAEDAIDQSAYVPQVQHNTLLINGRNGFVEQGQALGVDSSFWSWNAKAADLDNDGWQDIYVGNGFHFGDNFYEIQENILYRNIEGQRFEQVQVAWGLDDPINTPSYTYLDFDLDGDLDIIATGVLAPPRIYENMHVGNNAIAFALIDTRGNSSGIGAKVTIRYGGSESLQQRKENKLSGGFLSFDNPIVHFGIGAHESLDEVEIRWPDGERTSYSGPLPAGGIYRIRRQ